MEFKKTSKVYLYDNATLYRLHVRSVEFSQTYRQKDSPTRNLHQNTRMYSGASINEANAATFALSLPLAQESSRYQNKIIERLLTLGATTNELLPFELYIEAEDSSSPSYVYKLEGCVCITGNFNIPRRGVIYFDLEGEATKLTRVSGPVTTHLSLSTSAINTMNTGFNNMTYVTNKANLVSINGTNLDNVTGINFEVQNNGQMKQNPTLQSSLTIGSSGSTNVMYPTGYSLTDRILSGSIQQYVNLSDSNNRNKFMTWDEEANIQIKAGNSSSDYQLELNLNPCSYTNRVSAAGTYLQTYDFRVVDGAGSLSSIITSF